MAIVDPFSRAKFEVVKGKLKPGDVVRLASGGPAMTVEMAGQDDSQCVWITNEGKPRRERYTHAALLVMVPDDQKLGSG